ncbi:11277_t:CDS:2, partial [Cetraspora pellucida]
MSCKDTDDITNFASSSNSNTDNKTPQLKSPHLLRENLKFNSTWLITYPWLRIEKKENKKLMFCQWCKEAKYTNIFVIGCDNFKEQSLKRHLNNKDHQKTLQTQLKEQLNIHNIATNTITDLCSLIDQQIQNSQELHISSNINILKSPFALKDIELTRSDYGSYTNNHAGRDFINAIGEVIEQEICYEIRHRNGVAIQLKKQNPFLTEHHCISHRLALACEDAAETIPYMHTYNKLVGNLYTYFTDILGSLRRLILSFQSDYISLIEIKIQIATVIQIITESFIGTEDSLPTWGYHLRIYLEAKDLTSSDIPDFIQQFAIATVENLNKRFPDREILDAFCIFDSQNLPKEESLSNYGNDKIHILAKYYGTEKINNGIVFSPIINAEDLVKEWNFVRILLKNFISLKFLETWKILYQQIPNFSILYPNSDKIIALFLTLLLSNAIVERVFSRQNLIKTKLRNRLNISTLNYLLLISLNSSPINEFDFEHAYEIWANSP